MIIKKMSEKDIPELALLYKQFWNEESSIDKMASGYATLSHNDDYIFLNAMLDGQLVGSVQGIICHELYGQCRPFMVIENMIVDSSHRRKGIGKALITEIEKHAIKNDCYQILLVTESDRNDASKFYTSAGFNTDSHRGFKKKLNTMRQI
jgi:GNAT superfamily N-acetyltransferase